MLRWRLILGVGARRRARRAVLARRAGRAAGRLSGAAGARRGGARRRRDAADVSRARRAAGGLVGLHRRAAAGGGELRARSFGTIGPNVLAVGRLGWLAAGTGRRADRRVCSARCGGTRRRAQSIANVAHAALAVLYVGGLRRHARPAAAGRQHADGRQAGWRRLLPLLSMIATVKLSDIGQYFVGRPFGRHKLAPLISPARRGKAPSAASAWRR